MGAFNFIVGTLCIMVAFGGLALFFWGIPLLIASQFRNK